MYKDLITLLKSSGADSSVKVTVITGSGDYYCSGNDLSNFLNIPPEGPEHLAAESAVLLRCGRADNTLHNVICCQECGVVLYPVSQDTSGGCKWPSCGHIRHLTVLV